MVLANFTIDSLRAAFSISPAVVVTLCTAWPLHIVLHTQTANDGFPVGKLPVTDGTGETINLPHFCCILIITIEIKATRDGRQPPKSGCSVNSICLYVSKDGWKCFITYWSFEVLTVWKLMKLFHGTNDGRRLLFQSHCSSSPR
ncbi:unnamed protein product [Hymenolepis diminuta]|uniref:Uncharacterized protein n=1 Tax=Hymenolepis diminuta TaxID=6216 RepID=A0A564XVG8_HYMDI|nr:unnamed protein product [Hymenolepis diminuta]VUZ53781.1 unnamed protein product [Hymenolepis diminuta]